VQLETRRKRARLQEGRLQAEQQQQGNHHVGEHSDELQQQLQQEDVRAPVCQNILSWIKSFSHKHTNTHTHTHTC
jgi:signal recognition particle GTPase